MLNIWLLLCRIDCIKCGLLRSMILSVCQSVCYAASRGFDVQIQLNGSRSCLGWRLMGTKENCVRRGSRFPQRLDTAFVKLLWLLVYLAKGTRGSRRHRSSRLSATTATTILTTPRSKTTTHVLIHTQDRRATAALRGRREMARPRSVGEVSLGVRSTAEMSALYSWLSVTRTSASSVGTTMDVSIGLCILYSSRITYNIVSLERQLFYTAKSLETSGVQSCMPDASVIVRSSAGILNWRYQPCGQWPLPSQISSWLDLRRTTHPQYTYGDKSFTAAGPRMCGTVCHRTYDETLATDYLSEHWKHFCSGVNWPRRIVAVSCFVCALEIFTYFLTDLLIRLTHNPCSLLTVLVKGSGLRLGLRSTENARK